MTTIASRFVLCLLTVMPVAALAGPPGAPATGTPSSHLGYFKSFWAFRQEVKPAEVEAALRPFKVEVDERNGYLRASSSDEETDSGDEYTFVMWRGAGDQRVFGFSEDESGPDSEHHKTTFWSYAQGKWTRRDDVAPRVDLRDFLDETKPLPPAMYWKIWLKCELPRVGTSIVIRPQPIENLPSPEDEGDQVGGEGFDEFAYGQLVYGAKYDSLELRWDRASGKFVKGTRTVKQGGKASKKPGHG